MNYTITEFKSFLLGSDYNSASTDQQEGIDSEFEVFIDKMERLGQDIFPGNNLILNNSKNEYYIISELNIEQDLVVIKSGKF